MKTYLSRAQIWREFEKENNVKIDWNKKRNFMKQFLDTDCNDPKIIKAIQDGLKELI